MSKGTGGGEPDREGRAENFNAAVPMMVSADCASDHAKSKAPGIGGPVRLALGQPQQHDDDERGKPKAGRDHRDHGAWDVLAGILFRRGVHARERRDFDPGQCGAKWITQSG